jgi:hypothetical protein
MAPCPNPLVIKKPLSRRKVWTRFNLAAWRRIFVVDETDPVGIEGVAVGVEGVAVHIVPVPGGESEHFRNIA